MLTKAQRSRIAKKWWNSITPQKKKAIINKALRARGYKK